MGFISLSDLTAVLPLSPVLAMKTSGAAGLAWKAKGSNTLLEMSKASHCDI